MNFFKIDSSNKPIIHFITNYVTANDLANITSILGASPIMADEILEINDLQNFADCLVVNIGTVNQKQFESIKIACQTANYNNTPIILDPVGVGCSKFRQDVIRHIIENYKIAIIKGNLSEINYLINGTISESGIDACTNSNDVDCDAMINFCKLNSTCLVITGKNDYIIDSNKTTILSNGCEISTKLIGTGCMLGAVLGVYCSICNYDYHNAAIQAISTFNISMELAELQIHNKNYIGSFKTHLWDILGNIDEQTITKNIKSK